LKHTCDGGIAAAGTLQDDGPGTLTTTKQNRVSQRSHLAMTQADDDAQNSDPPARKVLAATGNEDNSKH